MRTGEISLQIVLALVLGFIFVNLGLRGRIGSGLAAIVAPESLQSGDFSGGNTEGGGQSGATAGGQVSFSDQLLQFITTGGFQENPPGG